MVDLSQSGLWFISYGFSVPRKDSKEKKKINMISFRKTVLNKVKI